MSTITRHAWVGVLGLVLANACSASSPPPPQPAPAPAPAPVPSAPPPAVAPAPAQPSASVAPAASAPAPTVDRCALSEPRVVVPNQALIRGFDVGHDGRLYWAQYEPMSRETRVLSLDTADREAKPQPIASAKMVGGPGDLVSLREGFWIEVDDDSRGVCGGRLMWLARDATRAVPVSNPACVFGPKRGAEGAEAIWGTSPTFSHAMQLFVAKGAPPQGVASVPRKVDGAFDVVAVPATASTWPSSTAR